MVEAGWDEERVNMLNNNNNIKKWQIKGNKKKRKKKKKFEIICFFVLFINTKCDEKQIKSSSYSQSCFFFSGRGSEQNFAFASSQLNHIHTYV